MICNEVTPFPDLAVIILHQIRIKNTVVIQHVNRFLWVHGFRELIGDSAFTFEIERGQSHQQQRSQKKIS